MRTQYLFNVNFELAALIALVGFIVAVRLRTRLQTLAGSYLLRLLCLLGIVTLLDITTALANNHPGCMPRWAAYLHNTLYFVLAALLCVAVWQYFCECIHQTVWVKQPKKIALLFAPLAMYMLILALNPFTHWMFYFDSSMVYHHGPLHMLCYFIVLGYVVGNSFYVLRYRRVLGKTWYATTVVYMLCTVGCTIVQAAFFPQVLLTYYGAVIGIILYYSTVQNPDAYLDRSTGALNREALNCMLQERVKAESHFTCTVVSLAGLEELGDLHTLEDMRELSFAVSDFLLSQMGVRNVFCIASDAFVLLPPKGVSLDDTCDSLLARFRAPWRVGEMPHDIYLSARLMQLSCPEDGASASALERAVHALRHRAEEQGDDADVLRSDDLLRGMLKRESAMQRVLERAIREDALEIYLQPLYYPEAKRVAGAEALVRLRDENGGIVRPDLFIPLAERSGLINQLGTQVMRKACAYAQKEKVFSRGLQTLQINLSPRQCVQPNLAAELQKIAARYEISLENLQFELTEGIAMEDNDMVLANLTALHEAGAHFALDDYGTGYSNLRRLNRYQMDSIKLDKALVWSYCEGETSCLEYLVPMFRAENKQVVAEGVETLQQAEMLISIHCDALQGYYYAKPMPMQEFSKYLAQVNT